MSMNLQSLIDTFIERHQNTFQEIIHNATLYYQNFRSHFLIHSEKSNQRYLFLSILLSFILLTLLTLIIFEYRRVLIYIQRFFRWTYSYSHYLYIRIRNKLLQKTTPSLLNLLLNSKSHIREKFSKEFLRSLNQELGNRKVQRKSTYVLYFIIKYDLCFFICTPYSYISLSDLNREKQWRETCFSIILRNDSALKHCNLLMQKSGMFRKLITKLVKYQLKRL